MNTINKNYSLQCGFSIMFLYEVYCNKMDKDPASKNMHIILCKQFNDYLQYISQKMLRSNEYF